MVDYQAEGMPASLYDRANVASVEQAQHCSDEIGYPVMIKASEGGGGKGIRKCSSSSDVSQSVSQLVSYLSD